MGLQTVFQRDTLHMTMANSLPKLIMINKSTTLRIAMLLFVVAGICSCSNHVDISEDKALVEATIRNIEKTIGDFDFKKADSMFLPDARWIEDGPPIRANDWSGWWQNAKNAGVRIEYKISDVRVEIEGNVAWATLIIKGTFRGDTPDSQALVGTQANPLSERQTTYVETYVMKKQTGTWKLALAHTSKINM
jgi:ketosteroid isomerase-like protein